MYKLFSRPTDVSREFYAFWFPVLLILIKAHLVISSSDARLNDREVFLIVDLVDSLHEKRGHVSVKSLLYLVLSKYIVQELPGP